MLSQEAQNLLEQCSKGEIILLIAPGKGFEDDTKEIMIEKSKITIIKNDGKSFEAAISIEGVASKLRNNEWEIKEAKKMLTNNFKEKLDEARLNIEKAKNQQQELFGEIIKHYKERDVEFFAFAY